MIRARIPATTANLGPGYDCMGLALDLHNTFELHLDPDDYGLTSQPEITVESHGEGAASLPTDSSNLVASVLLDELYNLNLTLPSKIHIVCHNTVPPASGLGSSSTATLAGVMFAEAIRQYRIGEDPAKLDQTRVLARAVAVEGHGDNVAPALLGGFVIVVPQEDGTVTTMRIPHVPLQAVVCVPDFDYPTSVAREALPATYQKSDAIFNIGRAMLVAEAIRQGDDTLLAQAMDDRLHEPYRFPKIPGAAQVRKAAHDQGAIAVALSGAGPGVIAFVRTGFDRIGQAMKAAFSAAGLESRYWIVEASANGAQVGRLPV